MSTFIHTWSPYGPSGMIEADTLDEACTAVHSVIELLGMRVTARHLPPEDGSDPMMPWSGAVLVVRSQTPNYGDNAQLRIAVYAAGQDSYFDQCRRKLEVGKTAT